MLVEHEDIHHFVYLWFEILILIFDDNQVQVYRIEHLDELIYKNLIKL